MGGKKKVGEKKRGGGEGGGGERRVNSNQETEREIVEYIYYCLTYILRCRKRDGEGEREREKESNTPAVMQFGGYTFLRKVRVRARARVSLIKKIYTGS